MSEWIRHRGSKSMPKCLEGKRFHIRYRDGSVYEDTDLDEFTIGEWRHANRHWDIMAYKIIGDIEQPKTAIELQAEEVGIPEPVQLVDDEQDEAVSSNKYQRTIKGVTVDVYDVLAAFGVTCQARGHAIKKLLMAGQRGHKDEAQDLREAVQAIERSIELAGK